MAVNYSNYGYPSGPSHQSPASLPLSSTPSNARSQRPRFGYSGLPSYPRPRSSASKPNPDSFAESTRGKFEASDEYVDRLRSPFPVNAGYTDTFQGQYADSEGYPDGPRRYNYGHPPESFSETPVRSHFGNVSNNCFESPARSKFVNSDVYGDSMANNYGNSNNQADVSYSSVDRDPYDKSNSSVYSPNTTAYYSCSESFYNSPKKPMFPGSTANLNSSPAQSSAYSSAKPLFKNPGFGTDSRPDFQGRFQNKTNNFKTDSSSSNPWPKKEAFPKRPKKKVKKPMASKSEWRCEVCSIEFTSSIPYEMHLRGAKHAKKLKAQDALQTIQLQVAQSKEIAPLGKSFRCDLCNVMANSSLQLQTHLDGIKHKTKLLQQSQSKARKEEKAEAAVEPEVNGKSNGAGVIRPLPSDFDEPQPSKMTKFSCDICDIIVNSDIQLQQHLTSKKHQAKVEGKPLMKKKFKRKKDEEKEGEVAADNTAETEEAATTKTEAAPTEAKEVPTETAEPNKTVVGVKTLAASFVQGGTLQ